MSRPDAQGRLRAFAEAYARCGIAEQAAIEAGYARGTARKSAQRMLAHPEVQAELSALRGATRDQSVATAMERKRFWTTILRDKQGEMKDRLRASELLGKADGDFIEKVESSGELFVRVVRE